MIDIVVWIILISWASYGVHIIKEFVKHNGQRR
jgi:hypothetical protein